MLWQASLSAVTVAALLNRRRASEGVRTGAVSVGSFALGIFCSFDVVFCKLLCVLLLLLPFVFCFLDVSAGLQLRFVVL